MSMIVQFLKFLARLFWDIYLVIDLEFQLVKYEVPQKDQGERVYSFGSILSGLNLKLA